MGAHGRTTLDPVERVAWLWSLEAAGRVGPDAARILVRAAQTPVCGASRRRS